LDRELEQMNEKHRMTFILRHQQGLSIKEISEIMACSEGTVKSRLFNAIKRLANRLRLFNSQTKKH
jgi:RNA polymerase sigma-70 factor (ECF subfamily)